MASTTFVRFWQTDLTRECFLSYLTKDDLCTMRLVSQGFSATVSPKLFKEIQVDFNATTFSRQTRLRALDRIGHLVETFTFTMKHTEETFLPPLLDPVTLEAVSFQYEPHLRAGRPSSSSSNPYESKFGSWEVNDLLVRQYPLLFHAATNTSTFLRVMSTMPNLQHLHISCPGQRNGSQHRRDAVDYALISLRMAVEQSNPQKLETLTLDPIHPSATFYLRPNVTIGCSPASTRVWRRIKTLNITMDSFETTQADPETDHLKILHTYLQSFSSLEELTFKWLGDFKGPSPLSLSTEPCTTRPSSLDYSTCISHEKRSSGKARRRSCLRPLHFRQLKNMHLENAMLDASQASAFIMAHRKTLHEFDFEDCHLRTGTWDDALSPLTRISGNEDWKAKQYTDNDDTSSPSLTSSPYSSAPSTPRTPRASCIPPPLFMSIPSASISYNEIATVPIMLSPEEEKPETEMIKDQLWQDRDLAYFDDFDTSLRRRLGFGGGLNDTRGAFDAHSLLSSWSRRKKGVDALRKLGARLGIPYSVRDSDIAMDSVRKLLKGCRGPWH